MISMAEIKLTEAEIDAAVRVLRSGALRQGAECEAFEKEFAEKVGARFAVTCANGTAALHLAYMAFLQPGDEVLVPSFTFIATGSMVSLTGGTPVFCDVDPETFLIDLEDAEKRVTANTKAIAPVHIFGNPCDIDALGEFAKRHNLTIVWDAAQAHGAEYKGKDVGSCDDFVCYSFYPAKNMFVGEGGMVCTNDADWDYKLRYLRTHGQTGKYYHTMLGLNYRMTDVEAAIGREQLKRLDSMLAVRRKNGELLDQGLKDIPGIIPQKLTADAIHARHQYCVIVEPQKFGCNRQELSEKLKIEGIGSGVHYPRGLHQQPVYEKSGMESTLPNTEYIAENILALPVHHGLEEKDIESVVQKIQTFCQNHNR